MKKDVKVLLKKHIILDRGTDKERIYYSGEQFVTADEAQLLVKDGAKIIEPKPDDKPEPKGEAAKK